MPKTKRLITALLAFSILLCLPMGATHAARITGGKVMTSLPDPTPEPTEPPPLPTAPPPPKAPVRLPVVEAALPEAFKLRNDIVGERETNDISMPAQEGYASGVEGVLTFRGGPYRQNAAYGYAPATEGYLSIAWQRNIGALDNWSGVGWNGQPALVRWPKELREAMNIYLDKKEKDDLVEAIYGTLDGNIYFIDIEDGVNSRDPIEVGFPMKGSVSVDPRGMPLLYSGQGISRLKGRSGDIGLRIFSLLDGEELYMINGRDKDAFREHGAFDSVSLVDAGSDTLISPGENGVLYTAKLNTQYDEAAGTITIEPDVSKYRYRNRNGLGIENSIAVYDHYGYFADNGGMLQCVDLNTMTPVWAADVTDDTDATIALDPQPDGTVLLFTGCEVDLQKEGGKAYMRCFNALTGEMLWEYSEICTYDKDVNGGVLGSPLVGKNSISPFVFFNVAKTYEGGGALVALDKLTGEVFYRKVFPRYGWSSPVAIYGADPDEVHILLGDSGGVLRLIDPFTGHELDAIQLEGNIEGSPAVFGDTLVVGTRGRMIYGIKIR